MINIYEPNIAPYTKSAIDAINSGWISNHGIYVEKSKELIQTKFNIKHAILMANGTCATHCLFLALKYKHPTINTIYVPNNAYVAAWNAALMTYEQSQLRVMKMDEHTWNIDTDEITTLQSNSAVLIVHNLGNIINVPKLAEQRPDLVFIEDNCEGFTGKYNEIYSGTSPTTLCSSASFYGNKIITTGEGGVFMTQHTDIYEYINRVYSQGMSSTRYLHDVHAYNYRMTNIEAAFLYDQLLDLNTIILKKQQVFQRYRQMFSQLHLIKLFSIDEGTTPANWMFAIRIPNNPKMIPETTEFFKQNNIDIRPFFYPIHRHQHLSSLAPPPTDPIAETLNREIVMLPSSPTIKPKQQYQIVNAVIKYLLHIQNITIQQITNENKHEIYTNFLSQIQDPNFRYFNKRTAECIDLHTYSIVLQNNTNTTTNEYIGYAHIDQGWFGIYLKPSYQNRGIGSLIVQYILNYCREHDIKHLQLAVDKTNERAIRLYVAGGFKPAGASSFALVATSSQPPCNPRRGLRPPATPPDQEKAYYVMDNPSLAHIS
jgi:perosamine synthetase